jgi:RHH-type rel operon transcriptional repressor/antitoxin RelB
MDKSTTVTVRLAPDVGAKLEALARDTRRSKASLAEQAVTSFVRRNVWQVARIKQALAEAESGAPGIPHEEVERWVKSWGTDHELPRPEPKA